MYNGEFDYELAYVSNERYKEWTIDLLNDVPDYFWEIPASSTGKYHPAYTLGTGGVVRHTKAAARIAISLFETNLFDDWLDEDKDITICAILLHDTFKKGREEQRYTVHEHPLLAADFVKSKLDTLSDDDTEARYFYSSVAAGIESHMGKWNTSSRSDKVLPLPNRPGQKLVHLCDYLASRKYIEIMFEEE